MLAEEKKLVEAPSARLAERGKFKTPFDYAMSAINDPKVAEDAKIRLAIAAMRIAPEKIEPLSGGKKEARQRAAGDVTGKFGVRSAPRLAIDNTK